MNAVLVPAEFTLPTTIAEAVEQALAPRTKPIDEITRAEWIQRRLIASTWVACSFCMAMVGERCHTVSDREFVRNFDDPSHAWRWEHIRRLHDGPWRWVLLHDDPDFKLSKGDVLICVPYRYDAKVTVLYRERDEFEPGCNQYRDAVRRIPGPLGRPDAEAVDAMLARLEAVQ